MRRGMLAGFTAALLATVGAFGSADAAVAAPDDSPRVPVAALAEAQRIATTGPISVAAAVDRLVGRTGKSASRAVAPTATTPVDDVAAAALICVGQVIIRSAANGLLISAELGYSGGDHGMLRARAAAVGPWELFTLCQDEASGLVLFVSEANGLAVSAELGYSGGDHGMLRARASAFGPWERFA